MENTENRLLPSLIEREWPINFDYIIIDFDSTLVKLEALDVLCEIVLRDNHDKKEAERIMQEFKNITEQGMTGKITFDQSLARRMEMIAPTRAQVGEAAKIIADSITESFLANRKFFSDNKNKIFIISGGFTEMMLLAIKKLGLKKENVYANDFIYDSLDKVIGVNTEKLTAQEGGKANKFKELGLQGRSVVIGDGFTDFEIKEIGGADAFIAFIGNVTREAVVDTTKLIARSFEEMLQILQTT